MSGLERVQILGTGGWGTAVAILLAGQNRPVSLWGRSPEFLEEMRSSGESAFDDADDSWNSDDLADCLEDLMAEFAGEAG